MSRNRPEAAARKPFGWKMGAPCRHAVACHDLGPGRRPALRDSRGRTGRVRNAGQTGNENRTRDAPVQALPDKVLAETARRPGKDEIVETAVAIAESVAASLAVRFRSVGQFGQRENLSGIVQERGACSLRDRQPCEEKQPEQCLRDETMKAGSGQGSVHPSETCSTAADTPSP